MLKFEARIFGGELPIGLGVIGIAVVLPRGDFLDEGLFVGNAAIEALGPLGPEFGFSQIESAAVFWSVVPSGCGRRSWRAFRGDVWSSDRRELKTWL
jgi:hypothetical protein